MKGYSVILILAAGLIWGCGEKAEKGGADQTLTTATATATENVRPEEVPIRNTLTEFFGRLRDGDKTVMYENEFTYYQMEYPLDKYYELERVKNYKYDTLKGIEIDSVQIMEDSAAVYFKIVYQSPDGPESKRFYRRIMYYTRDRWIFPYQSRIKNELEFRQSKREYDSATAGQ